MSLVDEIHTHEDAHTGELHVVHTETDRVLISLTVENMTDDILLCFLAGDTDGLRILIADTYYTILFSLIALALTHAHSAH